MRMSVQQQVDPEPCPCVCDICLTGDHCDTATCASEMDATLDIIDRIDRVVTDYPRECPHCDRDYHPEPLTQAVADMLAAHTFDPNYNPDTDITNIVCVGANYHGPNRPDGYARGGPVTSYPEMYTDNPFLGTIYPGAALPPEYAMPLPKYFYVGPPPPPMFEGIQKALQNMLDKMMEIAAIEWPILEWTNLYSSGGYSHSLILDEWAEATHACPDPTPVADLPDIDVEFGPKTWPVITEYIPPHLHTHAANLWAHHVHPGDLNPPIPLPEPPGYDFTQFDYTPELEIHGAHRVQHVNDRATTTKQDMLNLFDKTIIGLEERGE
jgi:hypothetical protein